MDAARSLPDNMHVVANDQIEVAETAQTAADQTFKRPTAQAEHLRTFGIAHPPIANENPQGLAIDTESGAAVRGEGAVPGCAVALKSTLRNNIVMSAITAGGYTGISYGIDAYMSKSTPGAKSAEKKVEAAEKALEKVEASPVATEAKVEAAERKVEAAEKTLEKAMEKTSGKTPIKTSSKAGSLLVNGISQLGISMGVRTAATCASASNPNFQKSVQYLVPLVSGSLRGVMDYYLFGKTAGRCVTDSMVVAGLEFASTGVVMGFR
jgi:hypothetical protein